MVSVKAVDAALAGVIVRCAIARAVATLNREVNVSSSKNLGFMSCVPDCVRLGYFWISGELSPVDWESACKTLAIAD
jgi:hypothetical protein